MVFVAMDDGFEDDLIQGDMPLVTMDILTWMGTCPVCEDTGHLMNSCGKWKVTF
jgi:hypothetical protein